MILIIKNASVKRQRSDLLISWKNSSTQVSSLDLELVIIVGSDVELSSDVINFLAYINVPVLIHSKKTDSVLVTPFINTVSMVRKKYYMLDEGSRILLAKRFIEGKIKGMLNVARYFAHIDGVSVNTFDFTIETKDSRSLIQEEAELSRKAWEILKNFMPQGFIGRKPRNDDPINRAIDYTYSIIYALCNHAVIASGLDPYAGLLHIDQPGRPSLVYDFSEMFKPVAIHTVMAVSRRGRLGLDKEGYLKGEDTQKLTRHIYQLLHSKAKGRRSVRGEIYGKANEVKNYLLKSVDFKPFVYRPD